MIKDVLEFHEKMNLPTPTTCGGWKYLKDDLKLRISMQNEENVEFTIAMSREGCADIMKEGLDLIYVTLGSLYYHGFTPEQIQASWDAVHASNMLKDKDNARGDGKILKPEGWQPPDILKAMRRA